MKICLRVIVFSSPLTSACTENEEENEEEIFIENVACDISVFYYFCIDFSHAQYSLWKMSNAMDKFQSFLIL